MDESTALIARPAILGRAVLKQSQIFLALLAPPFLAALLLSEWMLVKSLAPQIVLLSLLSCFTRRVVFPEDLRKVEALAVLSIVFLVSAVLVTPCFIVLGMPLLDALFEAVSGITSTGLSLALDTEAWPVSAHLLRGWIQWCGGFAIAFAGLALLSGASGASVAMGSSTFARRDNRSTLKAQARQILLAYCVLSALAVMACLLVLPNWWEALSIALAAVSTGGFSPRADSLASYGDIAQGVVILICIATAVSMMFYVQIYKEGPVCAFRRTRAGATFGLMVLGVAVCSGIGLLLPQPQGEELYHTALNFLSGISTAGFSVAPVSGHVALLPVFLVGMVIGGDIGSTAGGIKVSRMVLLFQTLRLTLVRARVPSSAVTYLREGDNRVGFDGLVAVTTLLVLYLLTLTFCWFVFLASEADPLKSLFEVVSALSTVGLSQGVTAPDLAPHLKVTLMAAMLLGRLEFIALLILCLPGTWLKGT